MGVTRVRYAVDGWGDGELWFEGTRLVWHELPQPGPPRATTRFDPTAEMRTDGIRGRAESVTIGLVDRIRRYFAGERVDFAGVALDLTWCTPFQQALADALGGVPYGATVTYGELAALAGHPNAQRAAGTFCARNRFPLVLPCHRVVASHGLGGYGSLGRGYKRRLLKLEGVEPSDVRL